MNSLVQYFTKNTKILFLIDGNGACITALSWIILFPLLSFGISNSIIYCFSIPTICTSLLGFYCSFSTIKLPSYFLKRIALFNISFSITSLILLVILISEISTLGKLYIIGEAGIVSTLAYIEWRVAQKI